MAIGRFAVLGAVSAGWLAACGSAPETSAARCERLGGLAIPAETIGLPSRGGEVHAVQLSAETDKDGQKTPAYCRVRGAIKPVDPAAPDILFEVSLPAEWNGKAVMLGGGGFDGTIPDVAGPILAEPVDQIATPLQRGYAVFASDSGHQAVPGAAPIPAVDAAFAVNDEALANYAGDALKKTRDVAAWLMVQAYGMGPSRTFFAGGSNGGREGLLVAERWPEDFDGVIVAFPFWNGGTTTLAFGAVMNAFARPGAYMGEAEQTLLYDSVLAACDDLDGAADGLVSNVAACHFDPNILHCDSSGREGGTCLTAPQIEAIKKYANVVAFEYRTAGREISYPGFPVLQGADLRGAQQLASKPPSYPATNEMPTIAHFWDQFSRFAIARDSKFNALTLDPERPGDLTSRINEVVDMLDLPPPEFAGFRKRGGRLIVYHGLADPIVSARSTEAYRRQLEDRIGAEELDDFARFFAVPGYGHGPAGSNAFVPVWDALSVLDTWVEDDAEPDAIIVTDGTTAGKGRTRPLCELGSWPKYVGPGSIDLAASFACVTSDVGVE